jgi:hypothetical protein
MPLLIPTKFYPTASHNPTEAWGQEEPFTCVSYQAGNPVAVWNGNVACQFESDGMSVLPAARSRNRASTMKSR